MSGFQTDDAQSSFGQTRYICCILRKLASSGKVPRILIAFDVISEIRSHHFRLPMKMFAE